MKYALDINCDDILKILLDRLLKDGDFIINLSNLKDKKIGKILKKKALISNTTNIDFYIGIDFSDISECKIYCDYNEESKKIYETINDNLKNILDIKLEVGESLYILKNTSAPAIYIKLPLENKDEMKNIYIDSIYKALLKIKDR